MCWILKQYSGGILYAGWYIIFHKIDKYDLSFIWYQNSLVTKLTERTEIYKDICGLPKKLPVWDINLVRSP